MAEDSGNVTEDENIHTRKYSNGEAPDTNVGENMRYIRKEVKSLREETQ